MDGVDLVIGKGMGVHYGQGGLLSLCHPDRMRHLYVLGKSGVGKSTLLQGIAVQDMAQGRGLCLLDPHGDLVEQLVDAVPRSRVDRVLYFDPRDREHPVAINPLWQVPPDQQGRVRASVVELFRALWPDSWGQRLHRILSNAVAALIKYPDGTLVAIPKLLTDGQFRARVMTHVTNPTVRAFWQEFDGWNERFRQEAIVPVLNRLDGFVADPALRNMLGQVKPSVDFRRAMDRGDIILANLARGELGVEQSNLIGGLIVASLHHAALSRSDIADPAARRPFHLIIDEFQDFGTDIFQEIVTEDRKFGLSLTAAHQFLTQISPVLRDAMLGNCGTTVCYRVSAQDAEHMARELALARPDLLTDLHVGTAYVRLLQDGHPFGPVPAQMLPDEHFPRGTRELVQKQSRRHFGRDRACVEDRLRRFWQSGT